MSREDGGMDIPDAAVDEIVRRLEERLESRRKEREGRGESELGEH